MKSLNVMIKIKKIKKPNDETNDETNNPDEAECQLPGFLQNSLIGNLAKELSEEINPTELGNLENFSNPSRLNRRIIWRWRW